MALLGILSDSHGEHLRTRAALRLLQSLGCEIIIHLGDVETCEVIDECAGLPVKLLFGNCDLVHRLYDYAEMIDVEVVHPSYLFKRNGIGFACLHGDDFQLYESLLDNEDVDVIFHGHSHEARDEMVKNTRCINPGALHRAKSYTVATFDTQSQAVAYHEVKCDTDV